jgi:hypothetical protein
MPESKTARAEANRLYDPDVNRNLHKLTQSGAAFEEKLIIKSRRIDCIGF